MKTINSKTWKRLLVLAGGMAVLAASYSFDDTAPARQVPAPMQNGLPPPPPAFTVHDIFRVPR